MGNTKGVRMTDKETMQMALDAMIGVEGVGAVIDWAKWEPCHEAIEALQAALANPEKEDVTHITDERIRDVEMKHEDYGFGRADKAPDPQGFHGFSEESLRAFIRELAKPEPDK
jgi:hypothetical protein